MGRLLETTAEVITNPFGNGHSGVDIGWKIHNDGILAHSQGTVTMVYHWNGKVTVGDNNSYGNFVKIKHPNGYSTLYAHLKDITVKQGQSVTKGQVIGHMGETGNCDGEHLHWEVHNSNSARVDPAPYVNSDLPGLSTKVYKLGNYKVVVDELNIRSGPGTNYQSVGMLVNNNIIKIDKVSNNWGHFDKGWSCLDYTEIINEEDLEDEDMTQSKFYEMFKKAMIQYNDEQAKKPTPDWAVDIMEWAFNNGIVSGDSEDIKDIDKLRPESLVKRDEAAAMIRNAYNLINKG